MPQHFHLGFGERGIRPLAAVGQSTTVTARELLLRISRWLLGIASLGVFISLAFSWLILPIYVNGESVLKSTGGAVKEERGVYASTLSEFLTRQWVYPGGIEVKAMYANETYFAKSDRASLTEFYGPSENFVFFVAEDVHTGLLPSGLPEATLRIGEHFVKPALAEGPNEVSHHRLSVISFPKQAEDGTPWLQEGDEMRLVLSHIWDRSNTVSGEIQPITTGFSWGMPLEIPAELLQQPSMSGAVLISLSVGLLSAVLTPCLLQLSVVFIATLGASGAEAFTSHGKADGEVKRRILVAALAFVFGYFILFTTAGALIGAVGKQAQIAFTLYSRAISIAAGILVIAFGIWLGVRSKAPVFCRLPGAGMMKRLEAGNTLGNVMIAIVYNLGCMSCFGGAIIATLFIYVGTLGSAWAGAVTMGGFALGLAVPFLLAALFFTAAEPLISKVSKHHRSIGLVSSLVVVCFGVLLLTDNFHTFSDSIYPYLGLG